ncbi:hypothetical protein HJ01_02801 [Flavobacterium frigoris PS1]|uniref:Uncharacterized protein n=1 Tax=Flavobacterium frigoris (strain PS1) TaxID=1086011 RepID=H7FUI5_FLAFP|nr:hypothetical protein HJ01_02801 [Flavobacterium frigoris PS1]
MGCIILNYLFKNTKLIGKRKLLAQIAMEILLLFSLKSKRLQWIAGNSS